MFELVLYFMLFRCALTSYHDQYKVPLLSTEKMESYLFNDREYVLYNIPVKWEDAEIICRGQFSGTLAILDSVEKAEFVAEVLSETDFSLDSVWVGARRSSADDPDGYHWIAGSKVKLRRSESDVMKYKEEGHDKQDEYHYPSWLNRTRIPVSDNGADCVGLTRLYHDKPVFLDLPCTLDRPLVCERDIENDARVNQMKTVRCKTGTYHVFESTLNWFQAASHCVIKKMTLAHVSSMECLKKIGTTMLKSRPSIEHAWVGAHGEMGKWTWVDDGSDLFAPLTYDDSNGLWPPMRAKGPRKQSGCLQVDRHTTHPPIFMEARCERKMQFVCYEAESIPKSATRKSLAAPPSDDTYFYVLVRQKLFWDHAYENCNKMNGFLASLDTEEIVTQLMLVMGENEHEPVQHIWVSGRLNGTKNAIPESTNYTWYNPRTGARIPDAKSESSDNYVPPWLDDEYTIDNPCLNLDRDNHLTATIYGLPCDTPQYSICMLTKTTQETEQTTAVTNATAKPVILETTTAYVAETTPTPIPT